MEDFSKACACCRGNILQRDYMGITFHYSLLSPNKFEDVQSIGVPIFEKLSFEGHLVTLCRAAVLADAPRKILQESARPDQTCH